MKNKDVEIIEVANGFMIRPILTDHRYHGWGECYVFTDEKELAAFIKKEFKKDESS